MRILKLKARLQLTFLDCQSPNILYKALNTVLFLHVWNHRLLTLHNFWCKQHLEETSPAQSFRMWLGQAGCQFNFKDVQSCAVLLLERPIWRRHSTNQPQPVLCQQRERAQQIDRWKRERKKWKNMFLIRNNAGQIPKAKFILVWKWPTAHRWQWDSLF